MRLLAARAHDRDRLLALVTSQESTVFVVLAETFLLSSERTRVPSLAGLSEIEQEQGR